MNGWKLVPVDPTEEMLRATDGIDAGTSYRGSGEYYLCNLSDYWKAMLAASPVPPAGGEVEVLAKVNYTGYEPSNHLDWNIPFGLQGLADGTELVDRAHVTHLQAENAALQQRLNVADHERLILDKLRRFDECANDCDADGVDIGRRWLETLTCLGLLARIQRSPAMWEITKKGEIFLEGRK